MTLESLRELAVIVLLIGGTLFVAIATLGLLRLPDVFNRMHAAAKTGTLGIALIMLATALHFGTTDVAARSLLVLVFFFLTVPIAAHLLGRSAYFSGVRLWSGSVCDDLRGKYDQRTHKLKARDDARGESAIEEEYLDRERTD